MDPPASSSSFYDGDHTGQMWEGGPEVAYLLPLVDRGRALHYFMASPFCDPDSNNMKAWLGKHISPATPGVLEEFPSGVEYVVNHEEPPHLYVIAKRMRTQAQGGRPGEAVARTDPPLAYYYLLGNRVLQAPTLHQVLSSRMARCVHGLSAAIARLQSDLEPLAMRARQQAARKEAAARHAATQDASAEGGEAPPPAQPVPSLALTGLPLNPPGERPAPLRVHLGPRDHERWRALDRLLGRQLHALTALRYDLPPEYWGAAPTPTPPTAPTVPQPPATTAAAAPQ